MILPLLILTVQLGVRVDAPPPSAAQAGDPPLTLSMAVARARADSPRRRGAAIAVDGARAAADAAGRLTNPLFELRSENWSWSSSPAAPDLDFFAVASQPIELGDKRGIRKRLALAQGEIAGTSLAVLDRVLALETVRAYVRALKARAVYDTIAANREGLTTIVTSVERRVAEGYSAEADLLRFKTEAARVDGDAARARLELERSLAALAYAIGATSPLPASALVEPAPLEPPALAGEKLAAAIGRTPEVLAATAVAERAREQAAYERARRLPEPVVTGGYKRTAGFDTAVLGVSIVLPLFDRNESAAARARGEERSAAAERDALVFQLTSDAAALIRAAGELTDRARLTPAELLAPAEEVRRAARAAFREGAADVLKLIDAERVYADVRRAAIELRLDALLATLEARFAIGEESIP
jgi:cobalt-zinc-cadmium efflux system outer membrane protein